MACRNCGHPFDIDMETYVILRDLAIIILAAKFMAIVAKKLKAPGVVGEIIA